MAEYMEHKEYIMLKFKEKIFEIKENNFEVCSANTETDLVDLHSYIRFIGKFSTLYEAFQHYCDPGTIVLSTGNVEDYGESTSPSPQIVRGLLGLHIIQVTSQRSEYVFYA